MKKALRHALPLTLLLATTGLAQAQQCGGDLGTFLEGVKATDADVKVDTRYVTNYYDTAAAKELAISMINDNKADILWGVAGLSGNGAAEAALESGKAWFIGVFAAAMTSATSVANINADKVVGFVGGEDSPVINDFLYGFLEGVKATDPEVKVDTRYVNSYVDTATAKEMGLSMISDNKADILWGVAGLSGNGAAEAALESGKAWFIGVDSDQEATFSAELAAITLTSGLKNVGQSIIWIFDEWDAGRTYWGQLVNLGLTEGGVGIVADKNFANVAPKAVQDKVLAAEAAIKDGTIVVPSAIGDDTNAVIALRDSMQP